MIFIMGCAIFNTDQAIVHWDLHTDVHMRVTHKCEVSSKVVPRKKILYGLTQALQMWYELLVVSRPTGVRFLAVLEPL